MSNEQFQINFTPPPDMKASCAKSEILLPILLFFLESDNFIEKIWIFSGKFEVKIKIFSKKAYNQGKKFGPLRRNYLWFSPLPIPMLIRIRPQRPHILELLIEWWPIKMGKIRLLCFLHISIQIMTNTFFGGNFVTQRLLFFFFFINLSVTECLDPRLL